MLVSGTDKLSSLDGQCYRALPSVRMVDNNNSSDPLGQHKCGSLEVAGESSGCSGGQQLVTAHSVESDLDQPRGRLRTKWHRRQT